jgi:hypothetical protein
MKLRLITTAALMACGAAQALTPSQIDTLRGNGQLKEIYLAGASAQRLFVAAWFQEQCKPATFDVFFNGTGAAPSGSSYRAYSCRLKKKVGDFLTDDPVLLVKRDTGGSLEGVNPIALATAQTNMLVDGGCTATGNPSPATDIQVPSFGCPSTLNRKSDAGFSDVEPALFQRPVNLPDGQAPLTNAQLNKLDIKTINQTIFGVAVNLALYRDLQNDQGLTPDDEIANRPTIRKSWVAAALQGQAEGGAKRNGWNVVFEADTVGGQNVSQKQVNVCRRTVGSGTQASSNAYFLNLGYAPILTNYQVFGQTYNNAKTASLGANVGTIQDIGTKAVQLGSSTALVETCLGTTVNSIGAYGLGVISRENNPTPAGGAPDKNYRFVRLDGDQPTRDAAKVGNYDFVYNATMQWNTDTTAAGTAEQAFVLALRKDAGTPTALNGADVDTQQGVMSPPTFSGTYEALADAIDLKFYSRVDRINNNSGTALRVVK